MAAETDLVSRAAPKRMLHISPDPSLEWRLAQEPHIGQLTADLDPAGVMVKMDISDIQFPDSSFEIVYCSHVLEHVPDDRRAMAELFRVLTPGGWAMLQVPLWDELTDEDPAVTAESERTARFGQRDHVRRYGRVDYPLRLAGAGFQVTVDPFPRRVGAACVERFGLTLQEEVHLARKVNGSEAGRVIRPFTELLDRSPSQDDVVGRVERVSGEGVVTGWAWKPSAPEIRPQVRAILDGKDVGGDVASRYRQSLVEAGIGDGRYCFRVPLQQADGGGHSLRIEAEGDCPLPPSTGFSTTIEHGGDPWYAIDVASERR